MTLPRSIPSPTSPAPGPPCCNCFLMAWNIADLIEHVVDAVPDRVALIVGDEPRTYAELEERANRLAHHLAGAGRRARRPRRHLRLQQPRVRRDDLRRVQAARGPDQRELPLRRGRAALPVRQRRSRRARARRAVRAAHRGGARVAADAAPPDRDRRRLAAPTAPRSARSPTTTRSPAAVPERDFDARSDDDIYILYTGGTTGHAEGCRVAPGGRAVRARRPRQLRHRACASTDEWQFAKAAAEAPADAGFGIVIAPLMHGAAQWGTINGLINGRTTVLMPKFDAHDVWQAVEKYRIPTLEHHRRRDGPPADRGARRRRLRRVVARRRSRRPRRCSARR